MSLGIPVVAPIPTPGVTASPTFEAQLVAWMQEIEAKLEAKVNEGDVVLTTGDLTKHGSRTLELAAAGGSGIGATYDPANLYWASAAGGNTVTKELPVQVGQRITGVACHGRNSGVAWTLAALKIDKTTGAVTSLGSVVSGTIAGTIEKKAIPPITEVVVAEFAYVLRWTAGAAADRFLGGQFVVDRP